MLVRFSFHFSPARAPKIAPLSRHPRFPSCTQHARFHTHSRRAFARLLARTRGCPSVLAFGSTRALARTPAAAFRTRRRSFASASASGRSGCPVCRINKIPPLARNHLILTSASVQFSAIEPTTRSEHFQHCVLEADFCTILLVCFFVEHFFAKIFAFNIVNKSGKKVQHNK